MLFRLAPALLVSALCLMTVNAAPRILVHGHRGARAIYPENTIPAFEYAIKIGADVLEMDVAVTKDNVLVISHDPHINPRSARARIPASRFTSYAGRAARIRLRRVEESRIFRNSSPCPAPVFRRSMKC